MMTRIVHGRRCLLFGAMMVFLLTTPAAAQDYMTTGRYVGDGTSARSITGIGFAPDLVIIKNTKGDPSVARTATMPEGYSANLGEGKPLEAQGILTLDPDGFTIDGNNAVNDADVPFFWVAMKSGTGHVRLGSFVGDGNSYHPINGLGFQPAVVILISDTTEPAILRTDTMSPGFSVPLRGDGPLADGILNLHEDGFVVGLNDAVNLSGTTMYYIAWPAADQTTVTGLYTGNENNNRTISDIGLDPEYMIVRAKTNEDGVHRMASVSGDTTLFFQNNNFKDDLIQAFVPNGFVLGTGAEVNKADLEYNWIGFANPPERTDLSLQMGADNAAPNAEETVTFDLVLTNNGPVDATGVLVQVPILSGFIFQSAVPGQGSYNPGTGDWTIGNLAVGGEANLTLTLLVNPGTAGRTLSMNALASAVSPQESDLDNNEVTIDVTVPTTDLVLSALVNDASPDAGNTVVYTVAVTNAGLDDGTGIAVSGSLPTGLVFLSTTPSQGTYNDLTGTWDLGTLPAPRTATLTILARVEEGTGGQILTVPFAVVSADQEDPDQSNNSRPVTITVTSSDLGLVKTVDVSSPEEGAIVSFRIVANNAGPSHATGIVVSDVLPAGLAFVSAITDSGLYNDTTGLWDLGSLASGSVAILDLQAMVVAGTGGQTLTNTASLVEADQDDLVPDNNTASAWLVVSSTDLQLEKTVNSSSPNEGDTITYTVTITNSGPIDATSVTVTDQIPAGLGFVNDTPSTGAYNSGTGVWNVGPLASGASETLQLSATVDTGTAGTTITNLAWISGTDQADPVTENDSSSVSVTVSSTDLQLTKIVDNAAPNEGETVVYTVTLTNIGPNDATGVEVTDVLPAGLLFQSANPGPGSYDAPSGLWTVGPVTNGQTVTLSLTAMVVPGTAGTLISNTAAITASDLADPDLDNNQDSADLTVSSTDLRVTKTVNESTPSVGSTVIYTIKVTNDGPNEATGVTVSDLLPGGLTLQVISESQGSYDSASGLWTVGTIADGVAATLTLTVTIDAAAAGNNILNVATVASVDQADMNPDNDEDSVAIDVQADVVTPIVTLQTLEGVAAVVWPGTTPQTVLRFSLANRGNEADTLRSLTISNLTTGLGAPDQAALDAEWQPLTVRGQRRSLSGSFPEMSLPDVPFTGGQATLGGFAWIIDPGDTLEVRIESSPSLVSRDGAVLTAGIVAAEDIGVRQTLVPDRPLPLLSGHDLVVDGLVADQLSVTEVPSGTLAVGTIRNLAFVFDVPANGYLSDSLYGLSLNNRGSAVPVSDISAMEAWADDGDGTFDEAADELLGAIVHSGELWQLTGLNTPVSISGRRFFVTVDLANEAIPGREISLELPVEHGSAVIMASGNDGPLDRSLVNGGVLAITVADRLVLTTEHIDPATTKPGASGVPLLAVNIANTYGIEQRLETLTVRNATQTDPAATPAERDAVLQQVILRLDGNGDGMIGDFLTDPALGSGAFVDGAITFSGLDLPLAGGDFERVFITADVSLGATADGDVLGAFIASADDFWAPGTSTVASWPLDSGAAWRVDGMVAAQITSAVVDGRTMGPGEGPEAALDLWLPANGYLPDRLVGVSVLNDGTAEPGDLTQVNLWADDGDGVFEGSVEDLSLGMMNWLNGRWVSPVLSHDIPVGGARFFVSVIAAAAPTDSATIRFSVPVDGVVMASFNSGPIDTEVPAASSLVLSTSALVGRLDFDVPATTTGQPGVLRMTVRNVSGELVTGITPTVNVLEGDAVLAVGSPDPASFDLLPDGIGEFVYNYTATAAGTIVMTGSSEGLGDVTGLDHIAAPSPSEQHRVHTTVPRLDTYPTDSLPANVARGQQDLSPLTLTLVNPGDQDVAVARLDSFRIRLSETASGPTIVPADLIESFTLIEGGNVYVSEDVLPVSGDEFVLRLSPPALITGSEPVTLGLRLDLRLDSTMPSFMMTIDGSTSFHAFDMVSGLPVPVSLDGGSFPIATKQANLVSNAGGLAVTAEPDTNRAVEPAQTDVVVATLTVRNDTVDPSASPIRIQALGFTPRRTDGTAAPDPSVYFDNLEISGPFQVHFMGLPQVSDSLVVMLFSPPLEVPVGANVPLNLSGDLKADAPLGALRFDFENLGQWLVEDAGDGSDVDVSVIPTEPVTGFTVVAPVTELQASGSGVLPATVGPGSRDLTALELKLVHPGGPGTAAVAWDSLNLQLLDEARDPLDPAGLIDRLRVFRNGALVGTLADPTDPTGHLSFGLSPEILAAGDTVDLVVRLDLSPEAPLQSFELISTQEGVVARDTISGIRPDVEAIGIWPVWSGLATIVVASEEISVGGTSLMPALLAPQTELDPVLQLTLANSAPVESGPLAVSGFTLLPAASDNDFSAPGAAVANLAVAHEGTELGRNDAIPAEATSLSVTLSEPLLVPAGESRVVKLLLGIRTGAPGGRLRLELEADGIAVGAPGSPPGGIRVVPAAGQSLPLATEIGNIGQASLADSYLNFPNPFAAGHEQTTFAYFLRDQAMVTLRLMTPHGGSVASILDGAPRGAGLHQEDTWGGENGSGIVVRNGVYIAELVVEFADGTRERILRKVAVLR